MLDILILAALVVTIGSPLALSPLFRRAQPHAEEDLNGIPARAVFTQESR